MDRGGMEESPISTDEEEIAIEVHNLVIDFQAWIQIYGFQAI